MIGAHFGPNFVWGQNSLRGAEPSQTKLSLCHWPQLHHEIFWQKKTRASPGLKQNSKQFKSRRREGRGIAGTERGGVRGGFLSSHCGCAPSPDFLGNFFLSCILNTNKYWCTPTHCFIVRVPESLVVGTGNALSIIFHRKWRISTFSKLRSLLCISYSNHRHFNS